MVVTWKKAVDASWFEVEKLHHKIPTIAPNEHNSALVWIFQR